MSRCRHAFSSPSYALSYTPLQYSKGVTDPLGEPARFSPVLPLAEKKECQQMKWMEKVRDLGRKSEPQPAPTPEAEARKAALRIEELEARLAPTAIWGE